MTLSFLYTVKYAQGGRRRDAALSALSAGLAASTKYNAGLIALPAVWAILGRGRWTSRLRLSSAYAGVAAIAFFAGTPYALLDRRSFLATLASVSAHLRWGHAALAGPGWIVHLSSSLRYGVGAPLLVAGIVGLVRYGWQDRRFGILFAIFPVAYFVLIGAGQTTFALHHSDRALSVHGDRSSCRRLSARDRNLVARPASGARSRRRPRRGRGGPPPSRPCKAIGCWHGRTIA